MATRAQEAWNKIAVLALCDEVHKGDNYIDNVRAQKLCFLSEIEGRKQNLKTAYYRFFRYKHGPYSTGLASDIIQLVKRGFIDPENGEMLERGQRLYSYLKPDIDRSELANSALRLIRHTANTWGRFKGWDIVDEVYKLTVPVDALGREMTIKDIPLKTDILIPERSTAQDVEPFSPEIVNDICEELAIPQSDLDLESDEIWRSVTEAVEASFSR